MRDVRNRLPTNAAGTRPDGEDANREHGDLQSDAVDSTAHAAGPASTASREAGDPQLLSTVASSLPDPDVRHAQLRRWAHSVGEAASLTVIWLAASALAIFVSHADLTAAALPAALALSATMVGYLWPLSRQLAAPSALVAALVEPSSVLPWTVAAICLSIVLEQRADAVSEPDLDALDRSLERCRRRGEPATVLVLAVESDAVALRNLLRIVRVTDSFAVRRSKPRYEVYGLLDECGDARASIESRFTEALHGATPAFGWASYPADGLTLEVLLGHARSSIVCEPAAGETLHGELSQPAGHPEPVIALTFDTANESAQP